MMATNVTLTVNNASTNYELSTGARGPAGASGAITSATTSDGTAALYLDSIRFESTNGGPTQLGEMAWESTDGSIDAQLENGVIAAFSEDGLIRVRNTSGAPIAKGDALRYTGTPGASGKLEVAKWVGANVTNAREFMGFAACAMENNSNGYAQWFGKLEGITTTGGGEAWTDGQIIYAVPGASATITDTAPTVAGEYVVAAAVINAGSGTSGSLFIRPSFAKNIASADIVDASSVGSLSTTGKAALYGAEGELAGAYLFAGDNTDYATFYKDRIQVSGIGVAATMNFPTTGSGTLMLGSNNLSDLSSASTARTNLGLGTGDSPTFAAVTLAGSSTNSGMSVSVTGGTLLFQNAGVTSATLASGAFTATNYIACGSISFFGIGTRVRLQSSGLGEFNIKSNDGTTDANATCANLTASGTVSAARMSQTTSTAADPTTTEYPTSGQWGVHKNTSSGDVFLAYNDGGSIKKVQLT